MNKERRERLTAVLQKLEHSKAELDSILEDEQEAYDNMPESLQNSERGETMQNHIDNLETATSGLEEAIDSIQQEHSMITPEQAREYLKQAFRDLIAQGAWGFDNCCQYLTDEGNSCIIGLLIKRQFPTVPLDMLRGTAWQVWSVNKDLPEASPAVVELFQTAQSAHDAAVSSAPPTYQALLTANRRFDISSYEGPAVAEILEELIKEES